MLSHQVVPVDHPKPDSPSRCAKRMEVAVTYTSEMAAAENGYHS
jgi:hypothetical protein